MAWPADSVIDASEQGASCLSVCLENGLTAGGPVLAERCIHCVRLCEFVCVPCLYTRCRVRVCVCLKRLIPFPSLRSPASFNAPSLVSHLIQPTTTTTECVRPSMQAGTHRTRQVKLGVHPSIPSSTHTHTHTHTVGTVRSLSGRSREAGAVCEPDLLY